MTTSWLRGSAFLLVLLVLPLAPRAASALDAGDRAPEFAAPSLAGDGTVELSRYRGKIVYLDFWASWCAPCREEMPILERLHKTYASQGLVIVGVSVDREAANARTFASRMGITFPIIHDAQHQLAGRFAPPKMPSSYVIDRRGVVRYVHGGFRAGDAAALEREIKLLLAQQTQ